MRGLTWIIRLMALVLLGIPNPTIAQESRETLRLGRGTVNSLDWRPDRKVLAVGSGWGVWLYDEDFNTLAHLDEQTGYVRDVHWNPNGTQLAVSSIDGDQCRIQIWAIETSGEHGAVSDTQALCGGTVLWNPEGNRLAISGTERLTQGLNGTIDRPFYIWNLGTDGGLLSITPDEQVICCQIAFGWSPDGKWLATASYNLIQIWNAENGEEKSRIEPIDYRFTEPQPILWTTNDRFSVACVKGDPPFSGLMCSWDANSGQLIEVKQGPVSTAENVSNLEGLHRSAVDSMAWNAQGDRLAASYTGTRPIEVWDTDEHSTPDSSLFSIQPELHSTVGWKDSQNQVITFGYAADSQSIHADTWAWNAQSGEREEKLFGFDSDGSEPVIAWSHSYQTVAVSVASNQIKLSDNRVISTSPGMVLNIQWSSDDSQLAVVSTPDLGYDIQVFAVETGEYLTGILNGKASVVDMEWNADDSMLATASVQFFGDSYLNSVHVFAIQKGEILTFNQSVWGISVDAPFKFPVNTPPSFTPALAWNPRVNLLAVSWPDAVKIYSMESETQTASFPAYEVTALDWSQDGLELAGGGNDGTIRIWDVSDFVEANSEG